MNGETLSNQIDEEIPLVSCASKMNSNNTSAFDILKSDILCPQFSDDDVMTGSSWTPYN